MTRVLKIIMPIFIVFTMSSNGGGNVTASVEGEVIAIVEDYSSLYLGVGLAVTKSHSYGIDCGHVKSRV